MNREQGFMGAVARDPIVNVRVNAPRCLFSCPPPYCVGTGRRRRRFSSSLNPSFSRPVCILLWMRGDLWVHGDVWRASLLLQLLLLCPILDAKGATLELIETSTTRFTVDALADLTDGNTTALPEVRCGADGNSEGDLRGLTLDLVTVIDPPFIMVDDRFTGTARFSGYLIDALEELSNRAGFAYTLSLPRRSSFDYSEAQRTVEDGDGDVYWGAFYITPQRLKTGRLTTPFAETPLAIITRKGSIDSSAAVLTSLTAWAEPFTWDAWLLIFVVLVWSTAVMFVAEGGTTPAIFLDPRLKHRPEGFVRASLLAHGSSTLYVTALSILGPYQITPFTSAGRSFSLVLKLLGVCIIARYTANSAASLTRAARQRTVVAASIGDLASRGVSTCVKKGSAYAGLLDANYEGTGWSPVRIDGSTGHMVKALMEGECDAIVDVELLARNGAALNRFKVDRAGETVAVVTNCQLQVLDGNLGLGPSSWAIGVRDGLPFVSRALSLHLAAMRQEGLFARLEDKWVNTGACSSAAVEVPQMGVESLVGLVIILVCIGVVAAVLEVWLRLSVREGRFMHTLSKATGRRNRLRGHRTRTGFLFSRRKRISNISAPGPAGDDEALGAASMNGPKAEATALPIRKGPGKLAARRPVGGRGPLSVFQPARRSDSSDEDTRSGQDGALGAMAPYRSMRGILMRPPSPSIFRRGRREAGPQPAKEDQSV